MKLKKYTIVCYILVLVMLLPLGSIAAKPLEEQQLVPMKPLYVSPDYPEPYIEGLGGESYLEIDIAFVKEEMLNILVTDTRTGKVWETNEIFTNPDKRSSSEERQKVERSQLVLNYTYDKNGSAANLADIGYMSNASTQGIYYSHQDGVMRDQIKYDEIVENGKVVGYKVFYGLGDVQAALYPQMISESRMNEVLERIVDEEGNPDERAQARFLKRYALKSIELLQEDIDREVERLKDPTDQKVKREALEKDLEDYIIQHPILEEEPIYEIYQDEIRTKYKLNQTLDAWAEVGYTREELELDNTLTGFIASGGGLAFIIPVVYKIEGNTFRVEICNDEIKYPPEVAISRIDVIPNFGAADNTVEEGYTFVPDGSGALIRINNPDKRFTGYQLALLQRHKDEALSRLSFATIKDIPYIENAILPVFGQKQNDTAFFAVIERGYEIANVNAYTSDRLSSFNTAYCSFFPVQTDDIYYSSGTTSGVKMMPKFPVEEEREVYDKKLQEMVSKKVINKYCRLPATNFVVRYTFLNDEDANYSGMANYFRNYLINTYDLKKIAPDANIPFVADVYGVIDKKVSIAGFPVNVKYSLTSFKEAEIIANDLLDAGAKNLSMRYIGMVNGGLSSTYANKFSVMGAIGGKKGYISFLNSMKQLGVDVYPDVDVTHVYKDKIFDGFSPSTDTVMTLGKTQSIISETNTATGIRDSRNSLDYYHPRWTVSPRLYESLFEKFRDAISGYENKFISLGALGSTMSADYRETLVIDRTQFSRIVANELEKFEDEGYKVIVDKGNFYTIPHVSMIVDLPMTSSRFIIQDYEVPFVQMALHGLVEYTGEPINVSQNVQYNVLKSLEYGAGITGRFMYEPDSALKNTYFLYYYSMSYKNWLGEVEATYKAVNEVLRDIQDQFIVFHERLSENVYRSVYENGTEVFVNYGTHDYIDEASGITVASNDFTVIKGGN